MTDRQFNRIMDELRGLRDFNDEQRTFNDEQRTFNKEISNKVDNLTEIVKKNHPEDFK